MSEPRFTAADVAFLVIDGKRVPADGSAYTVTDDEGGGVTITFRGRPDSVFTVDAVEASRD